MNHPVPPPAPPAVNPYAPPQANPFADYRLPVQPQIAPGGIWRQGKLLVMHRQAQLPPICVKSNQPAVHWLRRNLAWHEPWIAITILAGLLVYVILALILTQRATIHIGLSEEWMARRKTRLITCWVLGLLFLAMIPLGIVLAGIADEPAWVLLMLVGIIGGLIVLVAAQPLVGLVRPNRITRDFIWLKGVNRDFLDQLPVFPYRV